MIKWSRLLLLFAVVLVLALSFRGFIKRSLGSVLQRVRGKKTVEQRLQQYGEAARARWRPGFQSAEMPYPPRQSVLVGLKQERRLEVWAAGEDRAYSLIKSYPVLGASGSLGPKLREGDRQVPEGVYRIDSLNPNSLYHLSLRLNYPNPFDLEQATREGRNNPGSDIMIHGRTASIGCLAMGDEAAEDLFVLAADTGVENITVILSPVDFRVRSLPDALPPMPEWTPLLYDRIREALSDLDKPVPDPGSPVRQGAS